MLSSLSCRSKPKSLALFWVLRLERCVQVINNDLPTTLDSMERASLEFEELGQSLNSLTGALRRPKPPAAKPGAKGKGQGLAKTEGEKPAEAEGSESPAAAALGEMSAVEAIQAGTVNSMRKVAQDVSALAAVRSVASRVVMLPHQLAFEIFISDTLL